VARRIRGRGAAFNPPNRFEELSREVLPPGEGEDPPGSVPTRYLTDTSRTILARNDSPDIPFTWSINPYRGCEHGCIYCYARPSHEYLGFSAGVDFETRILVKPDAPRLLARALGAKSWTPGVVALSGNTDPYQSVERRLRLTRRCLEVFLEYRNPVSLITKNALVVRDADILEEMARRDLVHVMVSVTSLEDDLIRVMEPRASSPALRLQAIAVLAARGIPVGVNVAPVIPGLTDEEIPAILAAAAARGARAASYILVRLPGSVERLFVEWLERELPARSARVLGRIRQVRGGALSDARFHTRRSGEGELADSIGALFALAASRAKLATHWLPLSTEHFRRRGGGQGDLFDR